VSEADLALAHELADVADRISMEWFGSADLRVDAKPDRTFVTEADRAVEDALRARLAAERPEDGILGEELGDASDPSGRRWILDPIDGTHGFMRGVPVFGTLIALEAAGELVLGMASAPALGHRWWAVRGGGAFGDGRNLRVSSVRTIEDAHLSCAGIAGFHADGLDDRLMALARRCWRTRAFGDFWQHMLVAEGAIDVAVDPEVKIWDLAATKVIVEEAGGRFTDLTGVSRADGGSALSSNGLIHDEVLAALRG